MHAKWCYKSTGPLSQKTKHKWNGLSCVLLKRPRSLGERTGGFLRLGWYTIITIPGIELSMPCADVDWGATVARVVDFSLCRLPRLSVDITEAFALGGGVVSTTTLRTIVCKRVLIARIEATFYICLSLPARCQRCSCRSETRGSYCSFGCRVDWREKEDRSGNNMATFRSLVIRRNSVLK